MTVKEALTAVVSLPVDDSILEKAITDNDMAGTTTYTKSLSTQVDSAAVDVLFAMWSIPNVSEGGFSLSYDRNAIEAKLSVLADKCGRTDVISAMNPTISSKSAW